MAYIIGLPTPLDSAFDAGWIDRRGNYFRNPRYNDRNWPKDSGYIHAEHAEHLMRVHPDAIHANFERLVYDYAESRYRPRREGDEKLFRTHDAYLDEYSATPYSTLMRLGWLHIRSDGGFDVEDKFLNREGAELSEKQYQTLETLLRQNSISASSVWTSLARIGRRGNGSKWIEGWERYTWIQQWRVR